MPVALQASIDKFLEHLTDKRGYSAHTTSAYRRDLAHFMRYVTAEGCDNWHDVDIECVRAYAAWRHRGGLSGRSLQRKLSTLRAFAEFLNGEQGVRNNPARHVRAPRAPRKLPSVLDTDQMQRLLQIDDDDPLSLRDHAIMELAYSSGLRLAELVSLDLASLDRADGVVDVIGKGAKQRKVPVGRFAWEALELWLRARLPLATAGETALFVGRSGLRLTPRAIQYRVRAWAWRRGIASHVHPHMLRHAFASHLLESSGDLRAVQELLGHADIGTTQVYTHLDFQHLAQVYDKAHPRARK
ncbi:MAG: tyrosine recombinase XerC [Gammaproteobacteria bacterium]